MANIRPFQGVPKGLVKIQGRPVIEYVLDAVPDTVSDIMIAVGDESADAYREVCDRYMGTVLTTPMNDVDMVEQLRKPLENTHHSSLLVLPCDAPLITVQVTSFLLDLTRRFTAAISREPGGPPSYMPSSYQVKPLLEAMHSHSELGMDELLRKMRNVLYLSRQSFRVFDDKLRFTQRINSPADITRAERVLRSMRQQD